MVIQASFFSMSVITASAPLSLFSILLFYVFSILKARLLKWYSYINW